MSTPPWQKLLDDPQATLALLGIPESERADVFLHVVCEDPRYPTLCVNGSLNFGVSVDPVTGEVRGRRGCICRAACGEPCICDLG